jgi:hypothetical protein
MQRSGTRVLARWVNVILVVAWMAMLFGCSRCKDMGYFHSWETADRVLVKGNSKILLLTITDKTIILGLAKFAEAHQTGWSLPAAGTPIAPLTVEFFSGTKFLGHLGIGQNFLEAQGCDDFVSRNLSGADHSAVISMLGTPNVSSQ